MIIDLRIYLNLTSRLLKGASQIDVELKVLIELSANLISFKTRMKSLLLALNICFVDVGIFCAIYNLNKLLFDRDLLFVVITKIKFQLWNQFAMQWAINVAQFTNVGCLFVFASNSDQFVLKFTGVLWKLWAIMGQLVYLWFIELHACRGVKWIENFFGIHLKNMMDKIAWLFCFILRKKIFFKLN